VADASISQAGDRVAILGGSAGARTVDIAPIDGDRTVNVPLGAAQVRELRWAGDDYLLLRTANYLQIPQGEAYTFERHVVVDRQGRPVSRLLSNSPMSEYATGLPILTTAGEPRPTAHVLGLDWRPSDRTPNTRLRYNDNELVATVWRVDVASGRGQIVDRGNASTRYFQDDRSGGPRVRLDVNPFDGVETLFGRAKGASSWRQLAQTRDQDDLGFLGYSDADDSLLFVRPGEGGGSRIVRVALADGAETVVAEPAWPDAQVLWDEVRMQPVAVYGGVERRRYQWLDPALGRAQATLERAFRGREVTLWSWNAERTRVVARVQSRDAPPTWHLLDTAARSVSALGEAYPELSGARLGTTRWITYRARDGLEIPAWVTMPPARRAAAADRAAARGSGGQRRLRLRLVGAVPGDPRLCGDPAAIPRLRRFRPGLPGSRRAEVGGQGPDRPARRDRAPGGGRDYRSGARLRGGGQLRRLFGAGRRRPESRRLPLRGVGGQGGGPAGHARADAAQRRRGLLGAALLAAGDGRLGPPAAGGLLAGAAGGRDSRAGAADPRPPRHHRALRPERTDAAGDDRGGTAGATGRAGERRPLPVHLRDANTDAGGARRVPARAPAGRASRGGVATLTARGPLRI